MLFSFVYMLLGLTFDWDVYYPYWVFLTFSPAFPSEGLQVCHAPPI